MLYYDKYLAIVWVIQVIDQKDLAEKLRKVRDSRKNNRKQCARDILELLEYEEYEKATEEQLDTMLIWAIDRQFGSSTDADILLAAFGLLEGYHYSQFSLGKRRENILINSTVMKTVLKVRDDYRSASKDRQKQLRDDNLHNAENKRILSLAGFLVEYLMKNDIDSLMIAQNRDNAITLPKPNYILYNTQGLPTFDGKIDDVPDQTKNFAARGNRLDTGNLQQGAEPEPTPNPEHDPPFKPLTSRSKRRKSTSVFNIFSNITISFHSQKTVTLFLVFLIPILIISVYVLYNSLGQSPERIPEPSTSLLPTISPTTPPVEEIYIDDEEIELAPGQVQQLKFGVFPANATGSSLSFVSSNTNILRVSPDGMLSACKVQSEKLPQKATITIQSESGVTKYKDVIIDYSDEFDYSNEFGYIVEQEVRLAGEIEWKTEVDAKIGDKVEFLIQYKNLSQNDQYNVMIRDILPKNMHYVPNSTILFNGDHNNGALMTDDEITVAGVNIGNYGPKVNAYICFTAEVVDSTLQHGNNMLGNWSQCDVDSISLQDYTIIHVYKDQ